MNLAATIVDIVLVASGLICFALLFLAWRALKSVVRDTQPKAREERSVFLSYAREQREMAFGLARFIEANGIAVRMYDPVRRWSDPIRQIGPFIEGASAFVRLKPERELTPWMKFEADLADSFKVKVIDSTGEQDQISLSSIVAAVDGAPAEIPFRDADDRYAIIFKAFRSNVKIGDDRAPQDRDLYSSTGMALLKQQRGDSPYLCGALGILLAYLGLLAGGIFIVTAIIRITIALLVDGN